MSNSITKSKKPPKLGRPKNADAATTRANMIEAAMGQFGCQGYAATTIADVAKITGLTSGSIYKYFESKLDLYVETYIKAQSTILPEFAKAAASATNFSQQIEAIYSTAGRLMRENPALGDFLMSSPIEIHRHSEIAAQIEKKDTQMFDQFDDFVVNLLETHNVQLPYPNRHIAIMFTASLVGMGITSLLHQDIGVEDIINPFVWLTEKAFA